MITATLTPEQQAAFDATGQVLLPAPMTEHYAYCTDATCRGCLPSDEDVRSMHLLDLWVEMLKRCISQTPDTKTREGAIAAIVAQGEWYRSYTSDDPAFLGIRRPDPAWLALTEPCETCGGTGFVPGVDDVGVPMTHRQRCPVVGCVNGRKRIELRVPCDHPVEAQCGPDEFCPGTVLVATASVARLAIVVRKPREANGRAFLSLLPQVNGVWMAFDAPNGCFDGTEGIVDLPSYLGDPAALVGGWLALVCR